MKSQIRKWLACAEFQKIIDVSLERRRTIHSLIVLTYDSDPLLRWRSIDAIGRCAANLYASRPEALKNTLRRLFWSMSDESGARAWHAPEAIGEIIRSHPPTFADFIPMTIALFDLEPEDRPPFLPGILYALGRIGKLAPETVETGLPAIIQALAERDSQTRGMAVWCLGQIGEIAILNEHAELEQDRGKTLLYYNEQLLETTVGKVWDETIKTY